jgi:hypothetical protein
MNNHLSPQITEPKNDLFKYYVAGRRMNAISFVLLDKSKNTYD